MNAFTKAMTTIIIAFIVILISFIVALFLTDIISQHIHKK